MSITTEDSILKNSIRVMLHISRRQRKRKKKLGPKRDGYERSRIVFGRKPGKNKKICIVAPNKLLVRPLEISTI